MTRKKRLGRGLESLLNSVEVVGETPVAVADRVTVSALPASSAGSPPMAALDETSDPYAVSSGQRNVPTNGTATVGGSADGGRPKDGDIIDLSVYDVEDNPFQPRREFREDELASLAESLKEHNILQPILVRVVDGRYQLISGERRLRAAIKANWQTIPARIRTADDRLVSELAIVENLQRKDLNAIEKALSFRRYIDEHHCTQDDLAGRLKIDRSTIANLMRLLELPTRVRSAVSEGTISAGHARALLSLGDEQTQMSFTDRIIADGISVRGTERMVADHLSGNRLAAASLATTTRRTTSSHVRQLETEMKMALGTKVQIKQGTREKGQIVIHYANGEEFERIKSLMGS